MQITNAFLTPGAAHGRPGNRIAPIGIAIHYVGNPGSSAKNNRDYFESGAGGLHASAHYIVGLQGEILALIPEDERANHAGVYYGPPATRDMAATNNNRYIGIEVCHPDVSGKFADATRKALVDLCADICKRHGFNPATAIKRHYDITGKRCPVYYVTNPNEWDSSVNDICCTVNGSATYGDDAQDIAGSLIFAPEAADVIDALDAAGVVYDPKTWPHVIKGKTSPPMEFLPVLLGRVFAAGKMRKPSAAELRVLLGVLLGLVAHNANAVK